MISFLKKLFNHPIIVRDKSIPQQIVDVTDYNNQNVYFKSDLFSTKTVIIKGEIKDKVVIHFSKNKAVYGAVDINRLDGHIEIRTPYPLHGVIKLDTLNPRQKVTLYIEEKPFKYFHITTIFDTNNNIILHSGNMSFELKTKNQMTHYNDHVVVEPLDKLNPEYIKLKNQYMDNIHHLL